MLEEATKIRAFAARAHAGQLYGDHPYTYHLDEVYEVLVEFGVEEKDVLVAAFGHDLIEDTPTTLVEVIKHFGPKVAELIFLVTDKAGKNRAERHAATYPEIGTDEGATTLKLGDRIANTRAAFREHKTGLMKMYKKEYVYFKKTLYKPDFKYPKMWAELDALLGV